MAADRHIFESEKSDEAHQEQSKIVKNKTKNKVNSHFERIKETYTKLHGKGGNPRSAGVVKQHCF